VARLDDRIDRLYGLPLEEFTPARNELAKDLRAGGDRETADRVKRLKKPSAAAWAVNQVARSLPRETKALLSAGKRLRDVHERLAAGGAGADELRDAAEGERQAVSSLMDAARGLLGGRGEFLSQPVLDRVEQTFQAAAVDDEAREALETGRLTRERQAIGLGTFGVLPATVPSRARRAKAGAKDKRKARRDQDGRERDVERQRAQRERQAERKHGVGELRRLTRHAEAELENLRRRLAMAERRRADAERAAGEAKDQEKDARTRMRALERELAKAQSELGKLER
jgi:hypothetical protein